MIETTTGPSRLSTAARIRRTAFGTCLAILLVSGAAFGQRVPDGFYRVEKPEFGYQFFCPRTYKEIPVQPNDEILVGQFVRAAASQKGAGRPRSGSDYEMWVVSIPKPSEEPPSVKVTLNPPEPEDAGPQKPEDEGQGEGKGEAKKEKPSPTSRVRSYEELQAEQLSAFSFEELLKKRLGAWRVYSEEEKNDRERSWKEYRIGLLPGRLRRPPKGKPAPQIDVEKESVRTAAAWLYELEDRYVALLGFAPTADFKKRYKDFYKSARSLIPIDIEAVDVEKLRKYYERHPEYLDPEFRIERCQGLARGWKSLDTPNYLILYHTKDTRLVNRLEHNLEAMRRFYEEQFPPVKPVQAVSVVRVCNDTQEYFDYGGPPGSAGYWNYTKEELVLFDNMVDRDGKRRGNSDTFIVLFHEAFHQYIFYSTVELPPHMWFNEGYADFMSGAVVYSNTGRVKEIKTNRWRLPLIQRTIEKGKHIPMAQILKAPRSEFYNPARRSLYYAQAWSIVYFLEQSRDVSRNPAWAKISEVYFVTLKKEWEKERAALSPDAMLDEKNKAGQRARDVALAAALEDVDVEEFEAAWLKFVAKLR